jgi:hypothetical protein
MSSATVSQSEIIIGPSGPNTLYDEAQNIAGSKTAFQDVITLTLATELNYIEIEAHGFATRTTLYQIVHNNNGTLIVKGAFLVGAGQFTVPWKNDNLIITSGTGTQELKLQGKNLFATSFLGGDLGCRII